MYPTSPETIWLVEAVYALVEVKTQLSPTTLKDSVEKCRRFKSLARDFDKAPSPPRITDSLFIVWAFESASVNTAKESIIEALRDVPSAERPDFIIVPDKMIVTASSYFELTRLGQADSTYRAKLSQRLGGDINAVLGEGMEFLHLDSYSLFAWFLWLNSWLKAAGQRSAPLTSYLPSNYHFGSKI